MNFGWRGNPSGGRYEDIGPDEPEIEPGWELEFDVSWARGP